MQIPLLLGPRLAGHPYIPLGHTPAYQASAKNSSAPFCKQIQAVKMASRFFWWLGRHNLDSWGMYGA
jgi:hypothetical protein